ncbi:M16 family metallopeptidase [Sphingorhabdus sp. Alg239-R122]|uniref:M16 family metallopeptidase n=1 Tax=Sphingorhabdus sp. Alg239-R122 TaxID=2305989 RepID=UPI0013D9E345|nr:M16 family metallopeptidase [Sphingorhabdus sp. Alg239-R122]
MKITFRCTALSAFALSLTLSASPALAQPAQPAATESEQAGETPWLYENSNIPVDTEWKFGVLENGLRYAVRNNGVPPGQVAIRIRIDAGSLMEEDSEQGFAHLLEHMTFRGSKYVPDGDVIKIWQRFGATFGSDSNAETTPTQTVYKLDLPNASAAGLDESIKILSGMIREPGLTDVSLKSEVPIVLAELRERAGAQARVSDATRQELFKGQRLATRSPIGTVETLMAANSGSVRAFHKRWYRPENTVIVVSGDGEPAMFAELLNKYFADWYVNGAAQPHPGFGDPKPGPGDDNAISTAFLVEPTFPHIVNYAVLRPWRQVNDTISYNQGLFIDLLATSMIQRRLEARARGGGSFLQANVYQDDVSRSADATFVNIIPIGDDWQAALDDVRSVIEDARMNPPTEEEIAREVAEFDNALLVNVETADTEAGANKADEIVNAVDIRETVASAQTALNIFRDARPLFTPERLLQSTQKLFQGDVTRGILIAPKPIESGTEMLEAALAKRVEASTDARLSAESIGFDDLPDLGKAGQVVQTEDLNMLGMEVVTLSNGVRALLYSNDAEVAKVYVKVRFGNGYKAFSQSEGTQIWAGETALVDSGVGDLDREKLDRLTTGRAINFNFEIDDDAFEFNATTKPADLKDQLHLFAAKLAAPRWDAAPITRAKAGGKLSYDSYDMAPQTVMERDFSWLVRGNDNRWKTPNPMELDALTPEGFRSVWEPILSSGPIEVMLFGDFRREDAIAALEQTFGSLGPRNISPIADGAEEVDFPSDSGPAILRHRGDANQAAAVIAWPTGGGLQGARESRQLEILASLFNNRLFEKFREQAGASYAPQVTNFWPIKFPKGGYVAAISQLEPKNIPLFFEIAEEIAADLTTTPVSADELARITEPLKQIIERSSTGNSFWMWQLEGASYDRRIVQALRTLYGDYTVTTPVQMQALAQKYLSGNKWKMMILPEGQEAGKKMSD